MINTKVYVDNLAADTTEAELLAMFSAFGNVADVNIVVDRASRKRRGFGFVTMITPQGAQAAIEALNGKMVGSSTLTVSEAWPDEERPGSENGRRDPRRQASHLF
jgi:RNA recognition motif-containing protein